MTKAINLGHKHVNADKCATVWRFQSSRAAQFNDHVAGVGVSPRVLILGCEMLFFCQILMEAAGFSPVSHLEFCIFLTLATFDFKCTSSQWKNYEKQDKHSVSECVTKGSLTRA